MSSINDLVKRIVRDFLNSAQLADVLYGTVTASNPLAVTVDQRFTLTADFLIVPEHLTEYRLTIEGIDYEIRRGLGVGDRVILIRASGGRKYVISGRLP